MSLEFEQCLKKGKIRKFSSGYNLIGKELENAKLDLEIAKKSFKDKNYKWAIIQTYYSMFHSARALLYSKGFREKSHYCLIEAMRTLFVDKKLINYELIEALQKAKNLREDADYYGDFNKESAENLLKNAKKFYQTSKEILNKAKTKPEVLFPRI